MANQVKASAFHLDPDVGVWMHPDPREFAYSEGSKIEGRTLEILRGAKDLGLFSEELQASISDWPTLYHLSPARHNLLRHLRIGREMSVLELGAGCGAITRQLGESAGDVWAIEGGRLRAACAAARTRDLDNVRVFQSDFQAIELERRFDLVTLIGVLEYSPVFFESANPFLECLRLARSLAKPNGSLLIAIENQLGLKYFCGAPEDHTGKPYDGVQGLYKKRGVRTVGRVELGELVREAGFANVRFHYPFPDYKLPSWLLTERAFSSEGFDPSAILRMVETRHEGERVTFAADERKIRPILARNGLLEELSNSFLVIAGVAPSPNFELCSDDLLAAGYVTDRRPWFNIRTEMMIDERGEISVRKSRLGTAEAPANIELENVPGVEPYRRGEQLERTIVAALEAEGLDAMTRELRRWVDYLIEFGLAARDASDVYASPLKPEFFDCTPSNLIVEDGELAHIDVEWRYRGRLPLRTHVLRYAKLLLKREEKLLAKHFESERKPAIALAARLGIEFTKDQAREAKAQLRRLDEWIVSPYREAGISLAKKRGKKSLLSRLLRK